MNWTSLFLLVGCVLWTISCLILLFALIFYDDRTSFANALKKGVNSIIPFFGVILSVMGAIAGVLLCVYYARCLLGYEG